jgi:hypothetical protein
MSAAICEERATQPDAPRHSRPWGCAAFSPFRRCSSITERCGYAHSSRLGKTKNRQQRGMAGYFNRLLTAAAPVLKWIVNRQRVIQHETIRAISATVAVAKKSFHIMHRRATASERTDSARVKIVRQ